MYYAPGGTAIIRTENLHTIEHALLKLPSTQWLHHEWIALSPNWTNYLSNFAWNNWIKRSTSLNCVTIEFQLTKPMSFIDNIPISSNPYFCWNILNTDLSNLQIDIEFQSAVSYVDRKMAYTNSVLRCDAIYWKCIREFKAKTNSVHVFWDWSF